MITSARFLSLMAFVSCAACRPEPPGSVTDPSEVPDRDPIAAQRSLDEAVDAAAPPDTSVPSPRLEPERVQHALDDLLGYRVEQLAVHSMPARLDGFRNFIAFKASGVDYCRAYTSKADADGCTFSPGDDDVDIPWEAEERLGFAIVSFSGGQDPSAELHRYVAAAGMIWHGVLKWDPPRGDADQRHPDMIYETEVTINRMYAGDVDGDGKEEYIVEVASLRVGLGDVHDRTSKSADGLYTETHFQTRLLVARDDLSLEFDAYIEEGFFNGPGGLANGDVLRPGYEFLAQSADASGALAVHWCEFGPQMVDGLSDCVIEALCTDPTHSAIVAYDRESDSFSLVERQQLRPVIDDCTTVDCSYCASP